MNRDDGDAAGQFTMEESAVNIAILFAGGSGVRMGAGIPKQFLEIYGKPILIHTIKQFEYHKEIDKIYLAVLKDYIPYVQELLEEYHIKKVAAVVEGGETAQDTIYNALKKAEEENPRDSIVLIHDGVRPFITYEVISKNIECVKEHGNAITCTPCFETIVLSDDNVEVTDVPPRKKCYSAQAPQSFYLGQIIEAHDVVRQRPERYEGMVDACTIVRSQGITAHIVEGNRGNIKVTTPEDVYLFRALLQYRENEQAFGFGLTDRTNIRMNKGR